LQLTIAGLGPGPADMITLRAMEIMESADIVFMQTARHGAYRTLVERGIAVQTLDELYDGAADFDELNTSIAQKVVSSAKQMRTVFAACGHGLIGQAASQAILDLAKQSGIDAAVCPGIGYEAALSWTGIDVSNGYANGIAGGHADGYAVHIGCARAETLDSGIINIIVDVDSALRAGETKLALLKRFSDEIEVFVVQADMECAKRMKLCEIDRYDGFGPMTAIVVPALRLLERSRFTTADLMEICRILRSPQGCEWDRAQTHLSIRRNMMEECCEAMAAISEGDDDHLCEELGDVLLQVALHAAMSEEDGVFDYMDITTGICEKLIRRHPHIFGHERADTPELVLENWERIKLTERGGAAKNPLEKLGEGLPALMRAQEMQKQVEPEFVDLSQVRAKIDGAVAALFVESADLEQKEKQAGAALWALCDLLRRSGVHAETALADACSHAAAFFWTKG
jgi:tetrapyrrole methylase family protein/MazG family protein